MSDEVTALLAMAAAVNPPAAGLAAGRQLPARLAAAAAAIAAGLLLVAAALAHPALDALSVSPESFRVATGVVMIIAGAQVTLFARRSPDPGSGAWMALHPLAIPAIAGPAAVTLGINVSANHGFVLAAVAAAVGALLGGLGAWLGPRVGSGTVARFIAALLIVLAISEIVDGVKSV